jgi:hypothetical protein
MAMFKGKGERGRTLYRFSNNVGGGETTINFFRITKEKEEDMFPRYSS